MKRLNRHYLVRYKFLLFIPVCVVLIILILWLSGWFDEMKYIGGGCQNGDETAVGGYYCEIVKGEETSVSFEFTAIEGSTRILIYDTNGHPEDIVGHPWIENATLVDEIEVTEPCTISFEMHQYPLNRFYYITMSENENSKYEYTMSLSFRRSRIRNIVIEIFGAENLYGKTIQEYLFPFLSE